MDRRTFMTTGVCLSGVAGGMWPWLAGHAARRPTVAVIDSTLVDGSTFADYAAHWQATVVEAGDDIGVLWYTTLAPLLGTAPELAPSTLIGLTRGSDYFVLRQLATSAGHSVEHCRVQSSGSGARCAHVAFAFGPRLVRQNL